MRKHSSFSSASIAKSGPKYASSSFLYSRVNDSTVSGNTAGSDGGGLYFYTDSVDINRSTISGNTSGDDGGGFQFNNNTLGVSIHDSSITGNDADDDGGGAYFYDTVAPVQIVNTTVSGNTAGDEGGGFNFYYTNASVDISTSTIADNTAGGGGGGVYISDDEGGSSGPFTIRDSTISGNTAGSWGGGLYISYMLNTTKILNSTISGNTAAEEGGGINFNGYYGLVLTQDTITNNTATHYGGLYLPTTREVAAAARGHEKGVKAEAEDHSAHQPKAAANKAERGKGGAKAALTSKYEHDGETTSTGTIIAGNHSTSSSDGVDVGPGSVIHSDHSLFGEVGPDTTIDDKGGTLTNTNPELGPLANNGGPTQTHQLLAGSPAIDKGPVPATISTDQVGSFDQRGTPYDRVENGLIDIGAYEVQLATPPTPVEVPAAVLITPKFTG
jgi:hypothetical protein